MANYKNKCSLCGGPFAEEDKVVINAHAFVVTTGYSHPRRGELIPVNQDVKIRFRAGQPREVSHLKCVLAKEKAEEALNHFIVTAKVQFAKAQEDLILNG